MLRSYAQRASRHLQSKFKCTYKSTPPRAHLSTTPKPPSDPLRILFCGSDAFSCSSLQALHREHLQNESLVESLDVMVLPGKRTGRGLKEVREVPCKALAQELGLKIHQRETFRKWTLPGGINLIVVVSFGLFVPPRILKAAKYGGLNVHPSLLPDLRGPAPIHHALLRGDSHLGISLQTLHPTSFDHGTILSQTPASDLLPVSPSTSIQQITLALGAAGADMLVQGLRDGLHVEPYTDRGWMAQRLREQGQEGELVHAPKVSKEDAQMDWGSLDVEAVGRRVRVFGMVWTRARSMRGEVKRVLFLSVGDADGEVDEARWVSGKIVFLQGANAGAGAGAGEKEMERKERTVRVDARTGVVDVQMEGGGWLRVSRVKVDGKTEQAAATGLRPFFRGPSYT